MEPSSKIYIKEVISFIDFKCVLLTQGMDTKGRCNLCRTMDGDASIIY